MRFRKQLPLAVLLVVVPVPFVSWSPGGTRDILGEVDDPGHAGGPFAFGDGVVGERARCQCVVFGADRGTVTGEGLARIALGDLAAPHGRGFERRRGKAPTLYPVACAPQAWAACTPFALLQEIRAWFDGPLILSGAIST